MTNLCLDFGYLLSLIIAGPWVLFRAARTGRYRRGMRAKFFGCSASPRLRDKARQRVWFHGVSVGEIHLLRQVVARFRVHRPDCDCVISSTTDTGLDEARKSFPDLPVIVWPFDFSWAVNRTLDHVQPDLIVLAESELWPGMLLAARKRGIPVVVINGRLSPKTLSRYRMVRPLARWLFSFIEHFAVQTEEYAENLCKLGVTPEKVTVTGSVKYDGVTGDRNNPKTAALRRLFGIGPEDLIWVAGSTQTPEEEIVIDIFRRLQSTYPTLRLIIVPRQRDRFDEVAALFDRIGVPYHRRSTLIEPTNEQRPVMLLDTIGELSAAWGMANIAYVGGSLDGKRGGQNMIEPAAYGCAVLFGPHVWNFRETVARLLRAEGAIQIADPTELEKIVRRLLDDCGERDRLGQNARGLVLSQQGATEKTLQLVNQVLTNQVVRRSAA